MPWFPRSSYGSKVDVNLNLEYYVTQKELKEATGADLSDLVRKSVFDKLQETVNKIKETPHTTDEDTKKELKTLKDLTGKHTTDISDATQDIKKLQEDDSAHTKDINTLKASKSKLDTDIKGLEDKIKKLPTEVGVTEANFKKLSDDVSSQKKGL